MWRSRATRLGAFIVGTLTILAAGIFLIGQKQFLFTRTYHLRAAFGNVAGLKNGAEVRVGGIDEGTVEQIQLPARPDGQVAVVMELATSTRAIVKKDSLASVKTEGLLGDKYVAISFGSQDAPSVNDGDLIGSEPPLDISDLIKKTNQILDATKVSMGSVSAATDNLRSISSKIDQGKGTLGQLVNDRQVYSQLNAASAQAKAGATAFQEDAEALKHNWFLRGYFKKRGYYDSVELAKQSIDHLPEGAYSKKFVYPAKEIFSDADTARLRSKKDLEEAGRFLQANPFGLAVVVAYTGKAGDTDKSRTLSQAQAMLVRDYLVKNFKMDDTRLKTLGLGKEGNAEPGSSARVEIVVYPVGANAPPANHPDRSDG